MKLTGIIAYPITPFTADGSQPDLEKLAQSIELLLKSGSDAIAPLGSTGESAYLSFAEWQQVAQHSVQVVAKRVPVIIGISELTTEQAIQKARFAEHIGADAIMVIPVSYWKLTDAEIFAYYQDIAAEISLPIMIYNNPATSGVDMSPELIVKMFRDIPQITMVKESTGDIQRMHKIYQLSAGELPFYNGSNPLALAALCAGASGWCTAAPNLLGVLPKELYSLVQTGNLKAATSSFYSQLPLLSFIVAGGLPKTIKAGLAITGFEVGQPRKPLTAANEAERATLTRLLNQF
ncbi:dihydrodipicolinate synthase family protein [Rheinheimera riviphila]|uniref:Dihydrodipicolinate synthase family protein n=1 Tax=Rheinheimera riviphila TaxID=1834037 RepID=A0A437R1T5_9GAMM|nr:dihydrodipicolinate synthase family protein [Rheinheimera riviphila]RVU40766.1 dihydrodipicolinate synthase family protein [Rheinheimera riviphila]